MLTRTGTLIVSALLIATPTATAWGQGAWTGRDRVDAMVPAVIHALERDIAAEALATRARPWRITVASPDSVRWHAVLHRMRTMLHGRIQQPTDREVWVLAITERERTDSGSVYSVTVGQEWVCAADDRWVANERSASIVVRRRSKYWEAAPDPHPVIADRAPCGIGTDIRDPGISFQQ